MTLRAASFRPRNVHLVLVLTALALVACSGAHPATSASDSSNAALPSEEATASPAVAGPLDGDWQNGPVSCSDQRAALHRAGYDSHEIEAAGYFEEGCHTSRSIIRIKGDRLFFLNEDGSVDFSTTIQLDANHLVINDAAGDITVTYILSENELTVQRVEAASAAKPGTDYFADVVAITGFWLPSPYKREEPAAQSSSGSDLVAFVSLRFPISFALPAGWSIESNGEEAYFVSADNAMTLSMGSGTPEPDDTVADRVLVIQQALFKECTFDPTADVSTSAGAETAIIWSALCHDEAVLSLNTIHHDVGYLLAIRGPESGRAELSTVMDTITSTLAYSD
jgi:hypothetical protein